MGQDTIRVLKVIFPKKVVLNAKSSEYRKRFSKIFEVELFCRHFDQNFTVLTKRFTSFQSVRVTQVVINVLHWKWYARYLCSRAHSAYAAAKPCARATIGRYVVCNIGSRISGKCPINTCKCTMYVKDILEFQLCIQR